MRKIILLFLLLCSGLLNAQISLSEIQDTVGKGYVPITDYDPSLATYIQKYMLLQDYLQDSISWGGITALNLYQVLTNGNDAGGLDAINFAEVEADEFIGDLRGAVLFKAQAGETLAKGDVVYVSGISGNTTIVSKADADDAAKMPAFGVVAVAANSGNPVDIYTFGTLSNLNTLAFSLGDILYVSTTAGQLTATPPTGESALIQNIAKVTRVDNSAGSIKISGAGRTNATPNLNTGRLFVGNASNQAVADGTMYVDIANSRVGIGTSLPSAKLDVNGDVEIATVPTENTDNILTYGSTGLVSQRTLADITAEIVADPSLDLEQVLTNGNDANGQNAFGFNAISINSTSTPNSFYIDSPSNIPMRVDGANNSFITFVDNTETDVNDNRIGSAGGNMDIWTNGSLRLRIDNTGEVGIGTSSPSRKLTVKNDSDWRVAYFESTYLSGTNRFSSIVVGSAQGSGQSAQFGFIDNTLDRNLSYAHITPYGAGEGNSFRVYRNANVVLNPVSGNVGIAINSPSEKLHVNGTARFASQVSIGNVPTTSAADLYLYSSSNTNIRLADGSTYFDLFHNDGGGTSVTLLDIDPTGTSSGTNEFRIDIDNTREVTLTPSGMGLNGVTSPSAALDVNGEIEVTDGSRTMQLNEDGLLTTDGVLRFVNALGGYTTTYTTGSTAAAFSGQTTISGFDYFLLNGGTLEAAKDQDYFELKYQDHDGATHSSFTWDATWRFYEDGYFHTDAGIVHLNDEDTFFKFTSNKIQTYAGNSTYPKATYNVSGVTFNESKILSNNFRVNGTLDYMIFGDASANKVGIFEGSPSAELDVVGDTELNGDLEVNGEVTWSERALGRINSNNTTTDSDATPDLVVLDESIISINTTNDVTASNYSITVDNTGYYQISISGIMYGSGAGVRGVVYLAIGGTPVNIDESDDLAHEGDDHMSHEATFYMQLTAGQVLTLEIDRSTASGSMTIDEPSLEIVRLMGY